ncbi:hypothetical protein NMG60_11002588 [Bertholletia excelsa]
MASILLRGKLFRSLNLVIAFLLLCFLLVSAENSEENELSKKVDPNYLIQTLNSIWRQGLAVYQHVWPEIQFGWRIIVGTVIGFFGAAFGSVGGIGGGGIFVPMLTLIIGFDAKSAVAISKCMITGSAVSTYFYNINRRHPTIDQPLIDYDLALLIQPMLVLGISIGVALNVIFADWMVTVVLTIVLLGISTKAFLKGVETWRKETITKKAADGHLASNSSHTEEVEYKPLPGGPSNNNQIESGGSETPEISIIKNIYWKEIGILLLVWSIVLSLQIAKNNTTTCSLAYWILNLLQIPVVVAASSYEAISLFKGRKNAIASNGETGTTWPWHRLLLYCVSGVVAGVTGGLLGLGGGIVLSPLFLEFGIPPQVSSATAYFAMMFSASMSVVEFYFLKRFPVPYALYLAAVSTFAALVGQHAMRKIVAILGRASLIVFVLSLMVFLSAIVLGGIGISAMIKEIERKEYMGFDDFCSN